MGYSIRGFYNNGGKNGGTVFGWARYLGAGISGFFSISFRSKNNCYDFRFNLKTASHENFKYCIYPYAILV